MGEKLFCVTPSKVLKGWLLHCTAKEKQTVQTTAQSKGATQHRR